MAQAEERVRKLPADARRDAAIFLVLLGLTFLLYLLSIPIAYAVMATGPAAAFFGSRSLYRSRRTGDITGYRLGMAAGIMMSLFSTFMGVLLVVFREPITELQDCLSRALTQSAEITCQREYQESVEETLESLLERAGINLP